MRTLLALVLVGVVSCAHPPPLSPTGTRTFYATRVIKTLDVIRDFAVDAEAQDPKLLSTATTRKVVVYHRSAITTIHDIPAGWRPTLETGLTEVLADLPAAESARLAPYVALLLAVLAEVTP